jgi:hypothetical protein
MEKKIGHIEIDDKGNQTLKIHKKSEENNQTPLDNGL